jgi:hypothetical protein
MVVFSAVRVFVGSLLIEVDDRGMGTSADWEPSISLLTEAIDERAPEWEARAVFCVGSALSVGSLNAWLGDSL